MWYVTTKNYAGGPAFVPCAEGRAQAEIVKLYIDWKNKGIRQAEKGNNENSLSMRWAAPQIEERDKAPKGLDVPQLAKAALNMRFDAQGAPHKIDGWHYSKDVQNGSIVGIEGYEGLYEVKYEEQANFKGTGRYIVELKGRISYQNPADGPKYWKGGLVEKRFMTQAPAEATV